MFNTFSIYPFIHLFLNLIIYLFIYRFLSIHVLFRYSIVAANSEDGVLNTLMIHQVGQIHNFFFILRFFNRIDNYSCQGYSFYLTLYTFYLDISLVFPVISIYIYRFISFNLNIKDQIIDNWFLSNYRTI